MSCDSGFRQIWWSWGWWGGRVSVSCLEKTSRNSWYSFDSTVAGSVDFLRFRAFSISFIDIAKTSWFFFWVTHANGALPIMQISKTQSLTILETEVNSWVWTLEFLKVNSQQQSSGFQWQDLSSWWHGWGFWGQGFDSQWQNLILTFFLSKRANSQVWTCEFSRTDTEWQNSVSTSFLGKGSWGQNSDLMFFQGKSSQKQDSDSMFFQDTETEKLKQWGLQSSWVNISVWRSKSRQTQCCCS